MAASTEQKVDFLLKKLGYSSSKTGIAEDESSLSGTKKAPFAEPIPSPLVVPDSSVWSNSEWIPATPPTSDTSYVKTYLASASGFRMTEDTTVSGSRSFVARTTYGNNSTANLKNWIDTQFGADYVIRVYKGDPNSGGVQLSAAGAGSNDTWFFDYSSGVLNFNGDQIPSGVTSSNVYIVGYRYIGETGVLTPGDDFTTRNLKVNGISTFTGQINADSNVVIAGNLTVNGTETTLNTTSLEVEDINIGIASASSKLNDAQIDGAGLTIYSSAGDKTLTWDNSNSRMAFSTDLYAPNISVGSSVTVGTDLTVGGNLNVTGDLTYDEVVGRNLRITGLSTFVGVSTFQNDVYFDNLAYVGTGVTIYGDAGIVSARSFYGDGSNLTNTGATLTAASGTQRFVLTSLTSGTMVDAATDSDLTYNANTDTLGIRNLDVAVDATVNGDLDVDGHTELDNVNVSGVSTFVGVGTFKDDLWVAGDLNVSGDIVYDEVTGRNINITGLSTFTGIGTFASDLYVGGNLEVKGTTTFNGGTLTLGDSDTDNIVFGGEVDSHIIPDDDIVHNLGSNTKRWNDVHAKEFIGGGVNITGIITAGGASYSGGTSLQQLLVLGISTFQGPITAGSSLGVAGQYMRRTGTGVTWASFPKLRETVRYTATAGQTAFTWSHNVDFLDVFLNGVKLATTEYSNNGTSITLNSGCFAGDEVEFHSWAIASNYGAGGGGSSTLNGLTDVTLSSPSNGEVLKFNGTSWVNGTDEQGSVGSAGTWASTAGGISTTKNVTVPGFNATGISTLSGWVSLGSTVGAAGSIYIPDNKKLIFGNGEDAYIQVNDADDLYIGNTNDSGNIFVRSRDEYRLTNHDGSLPYFSAKNGQVDLFYGGSITLSSAGTGATVYNQLNVGTGVTIYNNDAYFAGVITATRFEGAISGVATIAQGLTGSPDITVRNITGVGATFSGNVSIGGTLTYEDVKNIDSVGIITARKDVKIQRNLTVTGISTFTGALNAGVINATTVNANVSGNVTGNVTGNASGTAGGLTGRPSITVSSINVGPTGAGATLGISTVSGSWSAQAGVGHTIDSYDIATDDFKTAEYTLWFNRGSNIQSQKLLVMQDGSTPYSQEFAIMFAPNQIVSIGASMTGTIVNINATPESGITGVTTYKLARNTLL